MLDDPSIEPDPANQAVAFIISDETSYVRGERIHLNRRLKPSSEQKKIWIWIWIWQSLTFYESGLRRCLL